MIKLRPYQEKAKAETYKEWEKGNENVLLVLPTGGGKCLGKDTPVLMCDGTVKMVQDVRQGDQLMGPDSTPRNVLSTCTGRSELFKITPIKGDPWVCNDAHILTLKHTTTKQVLDIPIKEYLSKSKNFKHLHKQFRVGVELKETDVPIDPYIAGLLLAEGTHSAPSITLSSDILIDRFESWCKSIKHHCTRLEGRGCTTIRVRSSGKWGANVVREFMRKHTDGTANRQFGPSYTRNTREVRLQSLAGVLDGDGHLTHSGYEIITKYDYLCEDILFLARSVGLAAYSSVKIVDDKPFHRIYISGNTDMIPCLLKKAEPRKQIKDVLNTGFEVESIGRGDYYGFEIDGDRRFLLGDFTVTHNTTIFCTIAKEHGHDGVQKIPTAIVVHRKELVQQISLTLCRLGIIHNLIAPKDTIKQIISAQRRIHGKNHYDYNSPITVVSVDTLNARTHKHEAWANKIRLWITDEAHHVLENNKWGKAIKLFPNAKGLGVTATPERLDKKGLGRHADGIFDCIVRGPEVKWMINQGFLCRWKAAVPQGDYTHFLGEKKGNSDYTSKDMQEAADKSQIVGDVVQNYIKFSKGKQAILFAPTISIANRMEDEFTQAGVKAATLTGNDDNKHRLNEMLKFENKETQVLINVDLFDEGLDCLSEDTEILTPGGWKNYETIKDDTHSYSWNPSTEKIELSKIKRVVKRRLREGEKFLTIKSQHTDIKVTENHNIYYRKKDYYTKGFRTEEFFVSKAKEIKDYYKPFSIPISGEKDFEGIELSNDELMLLGWAYTDGWLEGGALCISQSKPDMIKKIRDLINRLGYSHKERVRTVEEINSQTGRKFDATLDNITFRLKPSERWKEIKHLYDKNDLKSDLHSMTRKQFKIFWDSMMDGDGSASKGKSGSLCNSNKKLIDMSCHLAVVRGYTFTCGEYKSDNGVTIYNLSVRDKGYIQLTQRDERGANFNLFKGSSEDNVWCITNEMGTIITRRKGKVAILGNCPNIEVVILARPTKSLGKYKQMCGRGLRTSPGKEFLLIIDHAGNVKRHLYPDAVRDWTLDRIAKIRGGNNLIKICPNHECCQPYERFLPECPWCDHVPEKPLGGGDGRIPPEEVDGDLLLLDPWSLDAMNKATILETPESVAERVMHAAGVPASIKASRNQQERIDTQTELSEAIASWAGEQKYNGLEDRSIHKLFYLKFGKTIAQALADKKVDMIKLTEKLRG